jgi:hypothetical protein
LLDHRIGIEKRYSLERGEYRFSIFHALRVLFLNRTQPLQIALLARAI